MGENAACNFLKSKGYKILERNYRKSYGEVDIIAVDKNTLVFIEVKTRTTNSYGTPFDAISRSKIAQIIKTASYYKYVVHQKLSDDMRIDAIGVIVKNMKVVSIEHIENVSTS